MSLRIFVRSKWQISEDNEQATGLRSFEGECIQEFGEKKWNEMIEEIYDKGSAVLPWVRDPAWKKEE